MKTPSLAETNSHLKDPYKRAEIVARLVQASSAIEGIYMTITVEQKENGEISFIVKPKK